MTTPNNFSHVHRDRNIDCLRVTEDTRIPVVNNLANPTRGSLVFLQNGDNGQLYYANGLKWNLLNPGLSTTSFVSGISAINTGGLSTNLNLQQPSDSLGDDLIVGADRIIVNNDRSYRLRISYDYRVRITASDTANIAFSVRPLNLIIGADAYDTTTLSVSTVPDISALSMTATAHKSFSTIITVEPGTQIRWALPEGSSGNTDVEQYYLTNYTVEVLE